MSPITIDLQGRVCVPKPQLKTQIGKQSETASKKQVITLKFNTLIKVWNLSHIIEKLDRNVLFCF